MLIDQCSTSSVSSLFSSHFYILYRCGYDLCTASEIMSIADAMATNGMKELGYEYINLDGRHTMKLIISWSIHTLCVMFFCNAQTAGQTIVTLMET